MIRHLAIFILPITAIILAGCDVELRKSDAQLGLNAQQAAGRRIYDEHCARCHRAYSSRDLQGPSLKGVFKRRYLSSGQPANDDRVLDLLRYGRSKMPAYGQVLNPKQMHDLLAYLHTL